MNANGARRGRRGACALAAAALALASGCARSEREGAGASAAPAPSARQALGAPITAPHVPLADIARQPERYRDRVIATTGRVTAVCQEMGCWLELRDGASEAHVKIRGHSFFVPKTSPGHVAHVQARVITRAGGGQECDERNAAADPALARVELEATGVEID